MRTVFKVLSIDGPADQRERRAPARRSMPSVRLEGRRATCTIARPSDIGRVARGSVALRKFACGRGSGLDNRTRRTARAPMEAQQ
jgi:hypothetical protein